jgi:hypothetical protein
VTQDKFQIVSESLVGRGLSFAVAAFGVSKERDAALVDVAEAVYQQGRDSARLSYDDRFDLHCAVEALRALAVIVGPTPTGDRYRRCSDVIARLLQDQEGA